MENNLSSTSKTQSTPDVENPNFAPSQREHVGEVVNKTDLSPISQLQNVHHVTIGSHDGIPDHLEPIKEAADRNSAQANNEHHNVRVKDSKGLLVKRIKSFLSWCQKKKISFLFFLIPFIIANALYTSSDEICKDEDFAECLYKISDKNLNAWIVKAYIAALILAALIPTPLYNRKIVPIYIGPLALINALCLLFLFNGVHTGNRYAQGFGILLGIDLLLIFLIFGISRKSMYLDKRKAILSLIIFVAFFIACITSLNVKQSDMSAPVAVIKPKICEAWPKGLGGDQINNDITCLIEIPKVCPSDPIVEGINDAPYFDCTSIATDHDLMNRYYPPNAPIIGLPRIEQASDLERTWDYFQRWVFANSISLSSFEDAAAKDLEIFVDQRDLDDTKLVIKVKRNEDLVNERKLLQDNEGLAKNIIVIFIDTLSRPHFYTKLPKTAAWFEKFYNGKSSERESYQFFKFHGITPYTMNNMFQFNFGDIPDLWSGNGVPPATEEGKLHNFVGEYQKKGYITGRSGNVCDAFSSVQARWVPFFKDTAFDHDGIAFSCDPNYYDPQNRLSNYQGPFSMKRRCMYGVDTFVPVLEYGEQFLRTYSQEKKLLSLELLDAHEVTQTAITYLDTPLANFLEKLEKDGLLDDTMILFWADHGNHMPVPSIGKVLDSMKQERALPNLLFLLPSRMATKYGSAIKSNQQKLFSAHHLHELMMTFPNGENSPHMAMSPLSSLPSTLTCEDIGVVNQLCYCNYPVPVPVEGS